MKTLKLGKRNMGFLYSEQNENICLLSYLQVGEQDEPDSKEELDINNNGVVLTIDLRKMVIARRWTKDGVN